MAEIIKFRGLVLKKINYGDSSKIVTFFTPDHGKITGIIKGGRSSRSKIGSLVDVLNETEIIIYSKQSREVQLISQANLITHFPNIKTDLDYFKYAASIIELLDYFAMANEHYERLYKGTLKLLKLMDAKSENPPVLFVKYLIFFLGEVGFGLNFDECSICKNALKEGDKGFNFELGFLCNNCRKEHQVSINLSEELFDNLICLSSKDAGGSCSPENLNKLLNMLERDLMYHAPDFNGIKSLRVYN